jgi:hypothetical protein
MPATSTTPAPLEGRCLSRRDCEMPASSRRRLFDRSDQINQNSRGVPVSPRGAGQTKQKAISLRCRKIRIVITEVTSKSKLALLIFTRMYLGIASRREPAPRCVAAPTGNPEGETILPKGKWWSLTGSNRRHPACKAGALPAELRPHF